MACAVCGTTENLQRCGQCRMVVYCGVEHQRTHWPVHSQTCMAYPLSMDVYNSSTGDGAATAETNTASADAAQTANGMEEDAAPEQPVEQPLKDEPMGASYAAVGMTRPREPEAAPAPAEPAKKKRRTRKKVETAPAPVVQKEPTPEPKQQFLVETLWKTTLGMLVLREDKGFYGDGPNFDWRQGTKYLTDVKTKQTKGNKPVTEKWGKWAWDEKVYGPNNYGRFKIRIAANGESFKGTWGWGSRNRGGGPWTGSFVEETRIPIIPQEDEEQEADPLPNAMDEHTGESPSQAELDVALCHAAVAGEPEKISSLIAQGANVNNRLVEKCTPVMHAVVMDYPNVVRALLKAPVDLNARDLQGCTPLHICAEHGHVECTRVILEAASNENIVDSYLALMAPEHPLREHTKILARIAAYASPLDTSLTNDAGQTLFDLIDNQAETAPALSQSRSEIAEMVREYLDNIESSIVPNTVFDEPIDELFPEVPAVNEQDEENHSLEIPPPPVVAEEEEKQEVPAEEQEAMAPVVTDAATEPEPKEVVAQNEEEEEMEQEQIAPEEDSAKTAEAATTPQQEMQAEAGAEPAATTTEQGPEVSALPEVPAIPSVPEIPKLPEMPAETTDDTAKEAVAGGLELSSVGTVA